MFDITSGLVTLHVARTLGSTVMLGIMLFLSLPAATYALVPSPTLSLTTNPVQVGKGGAATLSWISRKHQIMHGERRMVGKQGHVR